MPHWLSDLWLLLGRITSFQCENPVSSARLDALIDYQWHRVDSEAIQEKQKQLQTEEIDY